MSKAFMALTAVAIVLIGAGVARAASVSGSATIFQNPFAGGTDTGGGDPGVTYITTRMNPMFDSNATYLGRLDSDAADKNGFMQMTMPSSVTARYVISYVYLEALTGGQETLNIKLGSTSVQNFTAVNNSSPWILTPLASPVTTNTLRAEVSEFIHHSGSVYIAGTNETLVISENIAHIPLTDADLTASGDAPGFEKKYFVDLSGLTPAFVTAPSGQERWLEIDLNGTRQLRGFVATIRNGNDSMEFQRPDGLGGWIPFASYTSGPDQNDFAAVRFDDSVPAMDRLRLSFGNVDDFRMSDLLLFEAVPEVVIPEPGAVGILAMSALLWVRRRHA